MKHWLKPDLAYHFWKVRVRVVTVTVTVTVRVGVREGVGEV